MMVVIIFNRTRSIVIPTNGNIYIVDNRMNTMSCDCHMYIVMCINSLPQRYSQLLLPVHMHFAAIIH